MSPEAKDGRGCPTCCDDIHTGRDATVFLMAVMHVPGKTPVVITTPRFHKTLPTDPTSCDICTVVGDLVDHTVVRGAIDIASELRARFKPQPTDELHTLWGKFPLGKAPDGSPG